MHIGSNAKKRSKCSPIDDLPFSLRQRLAVLEHQDQRQVVSMFQYQIVPLPHPASTLPSRRLFVGLECFVRGIHCGCGVGGRHFREGGELVEVGRIDDIEGGPTGGGVVPCSVDEGRGAEEVRAFEG